MTFPLSGADPGETEFGHGRGLRASNRQRQQTSENFELVWPYDKEPDGPWAERPQDAQAAIRRTNSADPNALADYGAAPGTANNTTQTQWIREK